MRARSASTTSACSLSLAISRMPRSGRSAGKKRYLTAIGSQAGNTDPNSNDVRRLNRALHPSATPKAMPERNPLPQHQARWIFPAL